MASHPDYRRLVRGAMLAPWFAVGVGLMVAGFIAVATPRAALTFPSTTGGRCVPAGCAGARPGPDGLAGTPRSTRATTVPVPDAHSSGALASDVQVKYAFPRRGHGQFTLVMVLTSHQGLGRWSLRFDLPGARIVSMESAAQWKRDGANGVIVDGSTPASPKSRADQATFVLAGTGTPGDPARCLFDGQTCTFHLVDGQAAGNSGHDDAHGHGGDGDGGQGG